MKKVLLILIAFALLSCDENDSNNNPSNNNQTPILKVFPEPGECLLVKEYNDGDLYLFEYDSFGRNISTKYFNISDGDTTKESEDLIS